MANTLLKPNEAIPLEHEVRLAQAGDAAARERLIEVTQHRLFRFCVYLTGNPIAAQDLAQETYIKALLNLKGLKEPGRFFPWLLKIAKNVFLDDKRRNRAGASEAPLLPECPLSDRSTVMEIQQAMAQLSPDERTVLLLVDLEGYSYQEAAEIIGISENAVRSRIHRSRERFAKIFQSR